MEGVSVNFSKLVSAVLLLIVCLAAGVPAASAQTVRVGYLHTLAVDGLFWIAQE